ncbi:MAG: hypothetical protein NDI60_01835 [Elusimicrobiales bacterium]|nr:hypothetical protein [Elusimicrobiales bacterium]
MKRPAGPQRPSRKFTRLVLLLRLAWLVPVTLLGLHYFLTNLHLLAREMYLHHDSWTALAGPLTRAGAGGALLYFTWKIWRKTWLILTDKLYPEKSALAWQAVWLALLILLPYWIYRG